MVVGGGGGAGRDGLQKGCLEGKRLGTTDLYYPTSDVVYE